MNIDDLTIGQVKQLTGFLGSNDKKIPFKIGEKYLFRTVTHIDIGLVEEINGDFITLSSASWVADTGRYHDCLKKGALNEVEPYPDGVYLNSSTLIDAALWKHDLPAEQK